VGEQRLRALEGGENKVVGGMVGERLGMLRRGVGIGLMASERGAIAGLDSGQLTRSSSLPPLCRCSTAVLLSVLEAEPGARETRVGGRWP
jgi:hypothetical protein